MIWHWQFATRTLVCIGLLLSMIAAALYVSGDKTPLVIDGSPIVAEGSRGSELVLDVPILNRGDRMVRVVGASTAQACQVSGCAKEAPDLPMAIKAHESRTTRVVYRIGWQDDPPYVQHFIPTASPSPNSM
jgi:hypothetical protein